MIAPSISVLERIIMAKEKNDKKWQKGRETPKVMIEKKSSRQKVDAREWWRQVMIIRHRHDATTMMILI